jgi:hypothetical protein
VDADRRVSVNGFVSVQFSENVGLRHPSMAMMVYLAFRLQRNQPLLVPLVILVRVLVAHLDGIDLEQEVGRYYPERLDGLLQ